MIDELLDTDNTTPIVEMSTSNLVVLLAIATRRHLQVLEAGGVAGIEDSVRSMYFVKARIGDITETDLETRIAEARAAAEKTLDMARTVFEVAGPELDRRVPKAT